MRLKRLGRIFFKVLFFFSLLISINNVIDGQNRKVYLDSDSNNEVIKLSFFSPSEGYVAFTKWIGYTNDSGRTFVKKYITLTNVNFNGYSVNLTFGFDIKGLIAFNKNNIIVYGDYGLVPAILYSNDGGNTFKLIYQSQFNPLQLSTGITDMIFPQNGSIGYAVDADRIFKTTDQGLTWTVIRIDAGAFYDHLEGFDNNNVIAMNTSYTGNKLVKTANGGTSWQTIIMPAVANAKMSYSYFITTNIGWLSLYDNNNGHYFYKTVDGGTSWTLLNNPDINPFGCFKMKFLDANTGFALAGQNTVFTTTNSGVNWEPIPRDNNYFYLNYTHNDLQVISNSQLWAGGGHGFLELNTNAGAGTLPKAYFKIDTTGLSTTKTVNLTNFSKTGYVYKWLLNNNVIGTSYNASYIHNINQLVDSITLIVTNSLGSDTAIKYQNYYPPVSITSFTPVTAASGQTVNITGKNFTGAGFVSFGGIAASSFTVVSPTSINAVVGSGASGFIKIVTATGQDSISGFVFLPPPSIVSFSPTKATAGTVITIIGKNFTGATAVNFGGIAASSFTVISSDTIRAIAPSGVSGNIMIITAAGTTSLSGFLALPTFNTFSPKKGTEGTILHISGTSLTSTTSISVGGIAVKSFTINSANDISAEVGTGASGDVVINKPEGSASLPGFTWVAPPVIKNFYPVSGAIGITVTISGTGFSSVAANNIVFFGAVRATVISSNDSTIVVTVPVGATYSPITINNNNLTAYSQKPFLVTFANGGSITSHSFATRIKTVIPNYYPASCFLSDLDGDGKIDIVSYISHSYVINQGTYIYRNSSTISTVSFDPSIKISNSGSNGIAIGDLDGDGKPDLAILNGNLIETYRNTSVSGNISFVAGPVLTANNSSTSLCIGDIDGDGKSDIALTCGAVFRNISDSGTISFAGEVDPIPTGARNIILADIDNDNKPDVILSDVSAGGVSIFKNVSTKGKPSFLTAKNITGYQYGYIAVGDIDGDNKLDIVETDYYGSKISISKNITTAGIINFANPVECNAIANPIAGIGLSDLDGDGKLDIAVNLINRNLAVFKNLSDTNTIRFAPKVDYDPGTFYDNHLLSIGDINSDGKNDIIVASGQDQTISVYLNNVVAEPSVQSFSPTLATTGTIVSIKGANFTGVSGVSFGSIAANSFKVDSSTGITAVVGAGASGIVTVTNNLGTGSLSGFAFGNPPIINSISSSFGMVGSGITINGNNFDTIPANNIVFFGEVKAVVKTATKTTLSVIVPPATVYEPIKVTVNGLSAYSKELFNVIFPGGGKSFSINSFAKSIDKAGGGGGKLCDLDGDGKLDLLLCYGNNLKVLRNTSSIANISFAADMIFPAGVSLQALVTGDLDGDGKPEIIAFSYDSSSVTVFKNNSTIGNISLAQALKFKTAYYTSNPLCAAVYDLDGDGKLDIVVANYSSHTISIFRNSSSSGTISFDEQVDYAVLGYPTGIEINDIDGDGKPDLVASVNGTNVVSVFRNLSIPGTISFANNIDIAIGSWPQEPRIVDLDGDNKPDIIIPNLNSNTISILLNTSSKGVISFNAKKDFVTGNGPFFISVADLDGDGKPDIAEQNIYSGNSSSILRNTSSLGNISFEPRFDYLYSGSPSRSSLGDIDGDGIPDMVVYNSGYYSISRNLIGAANVIQLCPNSDTLIISNVKGATYQWQQNSGNGFINISDNGNFKGTNTDSLQFINIPSTFNSYQYKCLVNGSQTSNIYVLTIASSVTPTISINGVVNVNQGSSSTITATITNGGLTPQYQWQDSTNVHTWQNITSAVNSNINYTAALTGNKLRCKLISNASCATPAVLYSNALTFTVNFATAVVMMPALNYDIKYYPNPVVNIFTIENLKISDLWQSIDITNVDGKQSIFSQKISGQTKVSITLDQLTKGVYFAILKRKEGSFVYIKFLKL